MTNIVAEAADSMELAQLNAETLLQMVRYIVAGATIALGSVGPAFAEVCGDKQDACASLAGSKMFTHTLYAVREYLDGFIAQQD